MFWQRESNFNVFVFMEDLNITISGPSSPNIECWLGNTVNFGGSGPILLGNPFCDFQGRGSRPTVPPPLLKLILA